MTQILIVLMILVLHFEVRQAKKCECADWDGGGSQVCPLLHCVYPRLIKCTSQLESYPQTTRACQLGSKSYLRMTSCISCDISTTTSTTAKPTTEYAGIPCPGKSLICSIDSHCGFDRIRRMHYCFCKAGFSGDGQTCTDIVECALGIAACDRNAVCTNTLGSFRCDCKPNYIGDGTTCTERRKPCPDESHKCSANAHCVLDNDYRCICKKGFEGDGLTCADVDECATKTDNCSDNALCTNTVGSFTCRCKFNFAGDGVTCI